MDLIEESRYSTNGDMVKRLREISAAVNRGKMPTISRALFDELTPTDKSTFVKVGLIRDELTRDNFNRLGPVERRHFVEGSGVITD